LLAQNPAIKIKIQSAKNKQMRCTGEDNKHPYFEDWYDGDILI
jgi:hypothetical protein